MRLPALFACLAACGADPSLLTSDAGPDAAVAAAREPTWSRVDAPGGPSARAWPALALAPSERRIYLFGGRSAAGPEADLWVLDLETGTWSRDGAAGGPPARFGHGAAYTASPPTVWIFGGQDARGLKNDLWAFDVGTGSWSERRPGGALPDVRYGYGALVPVGDRLVLTHGFASSGRHDDTWSFTGGAWTAITPSGERPLKRCLHATAVDETAQIVYLHGGCSSGFGPCPQADLWALDVGAGTWSRLSDGSAGAEARVSGALVHDESRGQLVALLGQGAGQAIRSFDLGGGGWSRLPVTGGPSARSEVGAVRDPVDDRIYVFGGTTAGGASDELWALAR